MEKKNTPFEAIYKIFLTRVTSDMYMELTKEDTLAHMQDLLVAAIPRFEFPRFNIFDYTLGEKVESDKLDKDGNPIYDENNEKLTVTTWEGGQFNNHILTREEQNIVAMIMVIEWLGQQLTTTENTCMKYSGSDFKFTSQANHMAKIKVLMDKYETESNHLQKLYKRRIIDTDGTIKTTIPTLMSARGTYYGD